MKQFLKVFLKTKLLLLATAFAMPAFATDLSGKKVEWTIPFSEKGVGQMGKLLCTAT